MQKKDDTPPKDRQIRRLLAVNLNYLGDGLFTTPALARLRAQHPDVRIDVIAGRRAAAILEGGEGVDDLLVRPRREGLARAASYAQALRDGRYDAVVLFQSIASNAVLAWANGVPIRAGFAKDGCSPFLTHRVEGRRPGEHIVDAYLRLVDSLRPDSAPLPDPALRIAMSNDDQAFAERIFRDQELLPPVVGLVIGATRPQKRWPEEYWAHLAEKLWAAEQISCVLLGGPEEEEAAQRILDRVQASRKTPLWSLVGCTTEKQSAALISRLELVVSGDTGPLHIATAMRVPVVALFGSTDPAETGPWRGNASRAPATILYDALPCAPCRKNPTCGGRFDCMRGLTPERVFEAASELLGLPARHRRTPLPVIPSATSAPVGASAAATGDGSSSLGFAGGGAR